MNIDASTLTQLHCTVVRSVFAQCYSVVLLSLRSITCSVMFLCFAQCSEVVIHLSCNLCDIEYADECFCFLLKVEAKVDPQCNYIAVQGGPAVKPNLFVCG